MSTFSEDDIRRAAEVREWLVKEVTNKKEEPINFVTLY